MKLRLFNNIEAKNASWLIGGKIAQMALSFVVGILTARYLGPKNYGLINYAGAYVSFFTSLCTLGINSVIIKDFIDFPEDQGTAIGTSIVLRFISSLLSVCMVIGVVSVIDKDETATIVISCLCSIALLFQVFDTINYWFQAQYMSKITAIASFLGYFIVSIYKIILLATQKSIYWFAFASSVDYIVVAVFLMIAYRRYNGQKLKFSFKKGKSLLSKSYHYILSGLMVSIYAHTDKLMLKQMLNETDVGFYSLATTICGMWVFVLTAIIDSMYPTILGYYKNDSYLYERKNKQLYAIVFYTSVFVSAFFVIFGNKIITILYGNDFMPAAESLKFVTWYTAFSYLGVARNAWLVCENKQKYLKYMYIAAAFLNVILNYLLIPSLGASGAALASFLTQFFVCILLPMLIKPLRRNALLMIRAILLQGVFGNK